jgi:hypothetical protein
MTESRLAPVALFVYNRPWHTRQTVEALQGNDLAGDSDLFIFSDAPKNPEAAEAVREVREYIKTISGFRSVSIIERDRNWGLANSIIDGVTKLCGELGRVIVLEDDLIVSPHFLDYMNRALERYAQEEKVMQISANMFPIKPAETLPETFFCRMTTSWGWATWDRAWRKFEPDAKRLARMIRARKLREEFDMKYYYFQMLESQARGEIDSWAIRWYASVFLAGGLCLHPSASLVSNIGVDGSGTHCGNGNVYQVSLSSGMPDMFPSSIEESIQGRQALEAFYRSIYHPVRRSVWQRLKSRAKAALRHVTNPG